MSIESKIQIENVSVYRSFWKCAECEQLELKLKQELKRMTSLSARLSVLKENFLKIYSSHFVMRQF